jgi:two-component system chemotaxis response regulator CheB
MARIRVLIVDDAVVVRRMVTEILSDDPAFEVAGIAANGRIALAKIDQLAPDVVILDVEMPEMNGLETLAALRKTHPRLPVVMFSTLTERGAAVTLEALTLGASDYATKPHNAGSVGLARQAVRDELVPKLKALCGRSELPAPGAPAAARAALRGAAVVASPQPAVRGSSRPSVLAVGVSTGGPNALAALLPQLPADFPLPVLVVQHMPPLFTRFLAERLDGKSRLRVSEAAPGAVVEPGRVWIAPGDFHMAVERAGATVRLRTHQGPVENSCRPAVDVLFRSVAQVYGATALGLVLTGMGQDGLRGSAAIREAGGRVLCQDEASSVVWGMPGYVASAGLAEKVLPLDQIATEILRMTSGGPARMPAPALAPASR